MENKERELPPLGFIVYLHMSVHKSVGNKSLAHLSSIPRSTRRDSDKKKPIR
jgi:hypothetical protein